MRHLVSVLILSLFLGCLFLAPPAFAQSAGDAPAQAQMDPKPLLKSKIDAVLDILKTDMPDAEKRREIEKLIDPVLNYGLMGKLALGPENWPKLSEQQRQVFIERFVDRLKASYFDKISMYQGNSEARITYKDSRTEGNKVHVPVVVAAADSTVNMVYKFFQSDSGWQVYDVEINGVSIVQSYRSQFNQVLARGSVDDLINELKKPVEPKKTQ